MNHFYSELFPDNFRDFENSILFLPIGTLEWHGAHLPFGTDFIIASGIVKRVLKEVKGFSLPPLYIGTDFSQYRNGLNLRGMDLQLDKKLIGSVYYLKPELFHGVVKSLVEQAEEQGFGRLVMITGHSSKKQIEVLNKIADNVYSSGFKVILINPYEIIGRKYETRHAGFIETSVLWAMRPDLIRRSCAKGLKNDELIKLRGHDPREKSSKELGSEVLAYLTKEIIKNINR